MEGKEEVFGGRKRGKGREFAVRGGVRRQHKVYIRRAFPTNFLVAALTQTRTNTQTNTHRQTQTHKRVKKAGHLKTKSHFEDLKR